MARALLTRHLLGGNVTEDAQEKIRRLAACVVGRRPTWTTEDPLGGPSTWAVLNLALEGVEGEKVRAFQETLRALVCERQVRRGLGATRDASVDGSWDPETLPGFAGGRIRLTACCLDVLARSRPPMMRCPPVNSENDE